jgi:hypothetical protein
MKFIQVRFYCHNRGIVPFISRRAFKHGNNLMHSFQGSEIEAQAQICTCRKYLPKLSPFTLGMATTSDR